MERLERLARTLVRAADGIVALPPDTVWCLAVLVAAWWLRDREIGATYRLATAGLSAEPLFARLDRVPGLPDVAASGMLELGQTPDLTRQRLVELAAKGASLTALAQWSGWDQAKAIVLYRCNGCHRTYRSYRSDYIQSFRNNGRKFSHNFNVYRYTNLC